ncbi:MAG: hypothetical protein M3070_13650 [Actinomycetota bacterium]|nr:hypothetical protein [Actinomycetota bacterium]
MHWIPWAVWIAAGVIAVVVLGFCAYELFWKSSRLRREVQRLDVLIGRLRELRAELVTTQQRAADSGR